MSMNDYIEKMKKVYQDLLNYIDKEDGNEEQFQNLIQTIQDHNITSNRYDLKTFLYILASISTNHHCYPHFFEKIEKIILMYKQYINKNFTNIEIYKIFNKSTKISYFLITNSIIKLSEIYEIMQKNDFIYFSPSVSLILGYIDKIDADFKEKRNIGENDDFISQLIRQDLIEEFIIFVKKNEYPLKSEIKPSIFETHHFLKGKNVTLIEYASFFGSVQICRYLYQNGVELSSSLWLYAIHSDSAEMINFLEENKVEMPDNSIKKLIKESIKCHNKDMLNYFESNYLDKRIEMIDDTDFNENYEENIISYCFHYYNFSYFPNEINNKFIFYYACRYDYFELVKYFLQNQKIDVNEKIIFTSIFFCFMEFDSIYF